MFSKADQLSHRAGCCLGEHQIFLECPNPSGQQNECVPDPKMQSNGWGELHGPSNVTIPGETARLSPPKWGSMCVSVCLSVCLSVRPQSGLRRRGGPNDRHRSENAQKMRQNYTKLMFRKIDTVGKSLKKRFVFRNSDQCFERFLPGVDFLEHGFCVVLAHILSVF